MLVLSRKVGQAIRIDQNITLMVVEVDGKNVKLGIHAPKDIAIHRDEVYNRIHPNPSSRMAHPGKIEPTAKKDPVSS